LDRVDPKIVEASKGVNGRKEANKSLHERNVRRKIKDGIARKMMGLKFIKVKETPEKI
jgi:hypothetical protein